MTQVRLGITQRRPDGTLAPVTGHVQLRPLQRSTTAPTEPTDVVVPTGFAVTLDGTTAPVVELAPGYWQGREWVRDGIARVVLVPDLPDVIDWADLVDVDPATLEPSESAVPAWDAAVAAVTAQADRAATAAGTASAALVEMQQYGPVAHHVGDGRYTFGMETI